MRKKQKKKNKNFLNGIIYLILIGLLIYSGVKIFKWNKENSNNNNITDKINEAVTVEKNSEGKEDFNINFNTLKKQNEDTVAWIKVNNTNVKYPVVKAKDNSFYLTHSFDKSNNSAGWIFADYKNKFDDTDKNIVIYGHNRRDGSMFSSLKNALNPNWYNNDLNRNILLYTENKEYNYEIFSIYKIESEDYYIKTEFNDENDFEDFLNTITKRSVQDFGVNVSKDDSILTLSTCANNNKYRVVIHAKKVIID
jgi:sortase B